MPTLPAGVDRVEQGAHVNDEQRSGLVLAAIPSLSRSVPELRQLSDSLSGLGMRPVIVATGRRLDEALAATELTHVSPRRNGGFGFAVRAGAAHDPAWQWLAIVNDDLTIDAARCRPQVVDVLAHGAAEPVLAYLDPTAPKPIPGVRHTLASLALLTAVSSRRRGRKAPEASTNSRTHFRPFSFVIISRSLWDMLAGLDENLVYTYEDSDFARRAAAVGATVLFCSGDGVHHRVSGTSGRHIATVLPVSAWSARNYLRAITGGAPWVTPACVAALVARTPLALLSSVDRRQHLRGIRRAIAALATGREPRLPEYDSC